MGDLGRRESVIETAKVEPVITHFRAQHVATGTTRDDAFEVSDAEEVTVTVQNQTQITKEFDTKLFGKFSVVNTFTISRATKTTHSEKTTITVKFPAAGYYGVYRGVRRVAGTFASLNCTRVDGKLQWVKRFDGPYVTFGASEEGTIRCNDAAADGAVRKAAQAQLGCFDKVPTPTARAATAADNEWPATPKVQSDRNRASAAGFACGTDSFRIVSRNGLVVTGGGAENGTPVRFAAWTGADEQKWQVCSNGTDELAGSVLINRGTGKCVQPDSAKPADENVQLLQATCSGRPSQQVHVYRDVAPSTAVGIQIVSSKGMWSSNGLFEGESLRDDSDGNEDGSGTFFLEKV